MKRRLFLLALFAIVLGFCTTSCKEKDNTNLANTQWSTSFTDSGITANVLLHLKSNNKFSLSVIVKERDMTETIQMDGTYSYNAPQITFSSNTGDDIETFTGTVSGKKLTLYDIFFEDDIVLTKK